jgi:hypothetical protein
MKGKTQTFLDSHPRSKAKKKAYDTELGKKPAQRAKRSELNKENRKRGTYGNGDKKDLSHTSKGLQSKPQSTNRGSTKDSPGDKRARGKKR